MGLFCGKKCRCKNRCKSWFVDPATLKGCKAACKSGKFPASAEDYLANIQSGDAEGDQSLQRVIYVSGGIIVLLILFYLYKKRK